MKGIFTNIFIYGSIVLWIFLQLISSHSHAQTYINSPYSRYGVGQMNENHNFRTTEMGGMSRALRKNNLINITNPASYSAFDSTSFVFEAGIRGMLSQVENKNDAALTNNVSFNYLLFGFPVGKRFAASFGLLPYSHMGYTLSDSTYHENIGDIKYLYEGSGGLNRAYVGTCFEILPNLAVGANMSYIFGNLKRTRTITFPEVANIYSLRELNATIVGDVTFDYGVYYEKDLDNNYILSLGLSGAHASQLSATRDVLIESFTGENYNPISIRDTVENASTKGYLSLPNSLGGGIVLTKKDRWLLGADYSFQQWSTFESFGIRDSLKNSMQFSLGAKFLPESTISPSLLRRSVFRVGVRYSQTYLELKNTNLHNYGISFGLGIPMQRSRTVLNVGVELGQKGTTDNNLIKETYGMLNFSLSVYERWFIRRKYN